jgi:hypothetical protein
MRIIAVTILCVAMLISGCVGVNGEPLEIPDGYERYNSGFLDGCMSSMLMLMKPQDLPPYDQALLICLKVHEAATNGNLGDMPSEMNTPMAEENERVIICDGNCI